MEGMGYDPEQHMQARTGVKLMSTLCMHYARMSLFPVTKISGRHARSLDGPLSEDMYSYEYIFSESGPPQFEVKKHRRMQRMFYYVEM